MAQVAAVELIQTSAAQELQQLGFDQLRLNWVVMLRLGEFNEPLKLLRTDSSCIHAVDPIQGPFFVGGQRQPFQPLLGNHRHLDFAARG